MTPAKGSSLVVRFIQDRDIVAAAGANMEGDVEKTDCKCGGYAGCVKLIAVLFSGVSGSAQAQSGTYSTMVDNSQEGLLSEGLTVPLHLHTPFSTPEPSSPYPLSLYPGRAVFANEFVYVLVPDSLALVQLYESLPSPALVFSGNPV